MARPGDIPRIPGKATAEFKQLRTSEEAPFLWAEQNAHHIYIYICIIYIYILLMYVHISGRVNLADED